MCDEIDCNTYRHNHLIHCVDISLLGGCLCGDNELIQTVAINEVDIHLHSL